MKNGSYVDVASFTSRMEAEALRCALGRQWMEARLVGEGRWGQHLFRNPADARVHVQVPAECYEEARRYLSPEQLEACEHRG